MHGPQEYHAGDGGHGRSLVRHGDDAVQYPGTRLLDAERTSVGALAGLDWMYQGGDHTVVVGNGGYRVVFAEATRADLKALLNALIDSK